MRLSQLLSRRRIKFIKIHIALVTLKDKTEKVAGYPKGWNKPEYWVEEYKRFRPFYPNVETKYKNHKIKHITYIKNSLLIPTGPVNNIHCIDIDSTQFIDYLDNKGVDITSLAQTISCRKKLPHLYIKTTDPDFQISSKFYIGDVEIGDLKSARKSGKADCMLETNVNLQSFKVCELNDDLVGIFRDILKRPKQPIYINKLEEELIYLSKLRLVDQEFYCKLIDYLPTCCFTEYDEWVAYGFMFKKAFAEDGFYLWDYLSQKCPQKYGGVDQLYSFWESLIPQDTGINKLFSAARNNNPRAAGLIYKYQHYHHIKNQLIPMDLGDVYDQQYDTRYFKEIPDTSRRVIVLDGKMGAGKTTAIEKFLMRNSEIKRVLIITPRITLSVALATKLGAKLYLQCNPIQLRKIKKLCIQLESLHKIDVPKDDYIVILDEFTSILHQLNSEGTMDSERRIKTYMTFEKIVHNASKTIIAHGIH